MSSVIFLKQQTLPQDKYEAAFGSCGFRTSFLQLLTHQSYNLGDLIAYLNSPVFLDEVGVFIITSQRATDSLETALKCVEGHNLARILRKTVYAVGPATLGSLAGLGFKCIRGGLEAGNGSSLADLVIRDVPAGAKVTFFTGELRKDIIPKKLSSRFDLNEVIIYKTVVIDDVLSQFVRRFDHDSTAWIVFFSPQGTQEIINYLKGLNMDSLKIASIGPTTKEYLVTQGITPHLVSDKPDAQSLLQGIQNFSSA